MLTFKVFMKQRQLGITLRKESPTTHMERRFFLYSTIQLSQCRGVGTGRIQRTTLNICYVLYKSSRAQKCNKEKAEKGGQVELGQAPGAGGGIGQGMGTGRGAGKESHSFAGVSSRLLYTGNFEQSREGREG